MSESLPSGWSEGKPGGNPPGDAQVAPASNDLFDGDLLPEELMSIYNEAVGEESAHPNHHTVGKSPRIDVDNSENTRSLCLIFC